MEKSKFHIYGIGVVSKDLDVDGKVVTVYLTEHLSTDGEIDTEEEMIENIKSKDNKYKSSSVNKSRTIQAEWLPINCPNRATAPLVRKNERILIYRYGGTDHYYWNVMYSELDVRKNENVIYVYSNNPDVTVGEFDPLKTYFIDIDTIGKKIHIHTADNDGEATTYDVSIDTKNGLLEMKDGNGKLVNMSHTGISTIVANTTLNIFTPTTNISGDVNIVKNVTIGGNLDTSGNSSTGGVSTMAGEANVTGTIKSETGIESAGDIVTATSVIDSRGSLTDHTHGGAVGDHT